MYDMREKERRQLLEGYEMPPRLVEVELSILSSMATEREALLECLSRIDHERDFYSTENKSAFNIMKRMFEKYKDVSVPVLSDKLEASGLNSSWVFSSHGEPWRIDMLIRELIEYRSKREIYMASRQMQKDSLGEELHAEEIQANLLANMNSWAVSGEVRALTISEIREEAKKSDIGKKLPMADPILNNYMYKEVGSHLGTTEVLMAHAKHGKSWYAAFRAADYARQGFPGLYVTLENLTSEVADSVDISLGKDAEQFRDNVLINDDAFELSEILRLIWQYKLKHDIKWAVVDYLQLVEVSGIRNYDEVKTIKAVSKTLTRAAKENGIFLLNVAQPKNISPDREGWDRALTADDLYGSGQIKKDAFCVTSLFRPGMYDDLVFQNTQSNNRMVKSHNGLLKNANSVFIRHDVQRKGIVNRQWNQLVHGNQGLVVQQEPGIEPTSSSNWKPIKNAS